ncbi:MAG: radical SAM/SPASM domain-containing protein [Elusimicrobiota bacterium]
MKPWAESLLRRFCPHSEKSMVERLWERKQYRKWANYLLVEYQMARGHALMLGRPYWLAVDPTNFCQLQCPFCPTGAGRGVRDKAALTLEHFTRFLDQVGPSVIHIDMMNWGEPTLNKELPAMIAAAKRHGIEVKVDSNLNDLTEAMADGLVRSGLDVLSVSIDGASQETYEKYRVGGRLESVLENVRKLARKKKELASPTPLLLWQFLVFKHNEHEAELAQKMARELGMDEGNVLPAFLPNESRILAAWLPGRKDYRLYEPPDGAPQAAADPLAVVRIQDTIPARSYRTRRFRQEQLYGPRHLLRRRRADVWSRAWTALRLRPESKGAAVPFAGAPPQPICKWPWAGMTVNPNGSVSPCCSVEDQADDFGNIFDGLFGMLWNGSKYRRSRRHVSRYARGKTPIQPGSEHVCERCTAIGYANFRFRIPEHRPGPSR